MKRKKSHVLDAIIASDAGGSRHYGKPKNREDFSKHRRRRKREQPWLWDNTKAEV